MLQGNRSTKRYGLLLSLAITSLTIGVPVAAGFDADRLARLDETFERYVAEGQIPGAVIQVNHRGKAVYHRAFGKSDLESNRTMRTDTIFRIASMSKAVISVAIVKLQERGAS